MVNDNRTIIQESIAEALSRGTSQNQLATQIGVSAGTLSFIRNGKWEDISEKMINKIKSYFRLDDWKVRNTPNFSVIQQLCDDAKSNRRMVALADYTGAGKTTALRHYKDRNVETWYVLATILDTKGIFVGKVCRAMGIEQKAGLEEMVQAICSKMMQANAPLLIIDDVGKLNDGCLTIIQVLYDLTEYNAGIVLSGTEKFRDRLQRGIRFKKNGFAELYRRISFWQPLYRPSDDVVEAICSDFDITDKNAKLWIKKRTQNYGDLRNIILNADALRAKDGVNITREVLESLHIGDNLSN